MPQLLLALCQPSSLPACPPFNTSDSNKTHFLFFFWHFSNFFFHFFSFLPICQGPCECSRGGSTLIKVTTKDGWLFAGQYRLASRCVIRRSMFPSPSVYANLWATFLTMRCMQLPYRDLTQEEWKAGAHTCLCCCLHAINTNGDD